MCGHYMYVISPIILTHIIVLESTVSFDKSLSSDCNVSSFTRSLQLPTCMYVYPGKCR